MGKLNEIQKQTTQSYGDNAFTTTIKDDTVEFDSLKDKFTFKDEVEVPSLKINGEVVVPGGGSQVQSDWNQDDTEAVDYIKNKPIKSGEGTNSVLIGNIDQNNATGDYSVAEGSMTTASGDYSHAEGAGTTASGDQSHAEGAGTTASGINSHVEGAGTTASGGYSHAEGGGTTASGINSHAEGGGTTASGSSSHAEGELTIAGRKCQHVFGKFNIEETGEATTEGTYVEIVGNGNNTARSNARTLDWAGNEVLSGTLTATGVFAEELTINGESVVLGGVQFKIEGSGLQASIDGGVTWKTVTLS